MHWRGEMASIACTHDAIVLILTLESMNQFLLHVPGLMPAANELWYMKVGTTEIVLSRQLQYDYLRTPASDIMSHVRPRASGVQVKSKFQQAARELLAHERLRPVDASPTPRQIERMEAIPGVLYLVNPEAKVIGSYDHGRKPSRIADEVCTCALPHVPWGMFCNQPRL